MKPNFVVFSRAPMAFVALAAARVLAGCPEAAKTSKDVGFGTEALMVVGP